MRKIALLILTAIWFLLSIIIQKPFLPPPHRVLFHTFILLVKGELWKHFLISSYRILASISIGIILAAPLAILAGRIRYFDRLFTPAAQILFPVPKVAFLPVIMLVMGLGDSSKITLIVLIIFFQLFFVIRDAAAGIDQRYINSILSLGASRGQIFKHVVLPSILPGLFTALRVSAGTSTAVLFLAETFASRTGLGWYIIDSWIRLDYHDMYAGILSLSLLGVLLFFIFELSEKLFCRWRNVSGKITE